MTTNTTHEGLIVVGVDGSDASVAALHWAVAEAELLGGRVKAVMTWHMPYPSYGVPFPTDLELRHHTLQRLQRVIESAVGIEPPVPVQPCVTSGSPAPTLCQEAASADLLVIGSSGHGALAGTLLGSTSRYCVAHATCPTVVVRSDKQG